LVEYDPARLSPTADARGVDEDIICHVRFSPGDRQHTGKVAKAATASSPSAVTGQPPFEVQVPSDAATVELWFERRGGATTTGWDSRYGQNYSFVVAAKGLSVPEPTVAARAEATADTAKIRVADDTASKKQTIMGSGAKRLHTGLVLRALINELALPADVWADIHVFDAADELIATHSVILRRQESTGDGALFVWGDEIYQGSGGGSGMGVWSRPDAHTIQYRLYCKANASGLQTQIFTDGVLHEFEVPADEEVMAPDQRRDTP
jgi:hypothetical protein